MVSDSDADWQTAVLRLAIAEPVELAEPRSARVVAVDVAEDGAAYETLTAFVLDPLVWQSTPYRALALRSRSSPGLLEALSIGEPVVCHAVGVHASALDLPPTDQFDRSRGGLRLTVAATASAVGHRAEGAAASRLHVMAQTDVDAAVMIWSGFGLSSWPQRDPQRLREAFGAARADELQPIVRALEHDFYATDARDTALTLEEMGDAAVRDFARLHPEVGADATEALAWCYTWDYK